jgi:hypothetical protein
MSFKILLIIGIVGFIIYKIGRFIYRVNKIYTTIKKTIRQEFMQDEPTAFRKVGDFEIRQPSRPSSKTKNDEGYTDFEEVK